MAWLVFTLSALICYNLCMLAFVFCRKNLTHPHQFLLETNCLVKSASYRYMYIQANKNVLVSQILLHSQIKLLPKYSDMKKTTFIIFFFHM